MSSNTIGKNKILGKRQLLLLILGIILFFGALIIAYFVWQLQRQNQVTKTIAAIRAEYNLLKDLDPEEDKQEVEEKEQELLKKLDEIISSNKNAAITEQALWHKFDIAQEDKNLDEQIKDLRALTTEHQNSAFYFPALLSLATSLFEKEAKAEALKIWEEIIANGKAPLVAQAMANINMAIYNESKGANKEAVDYFTTSKSLLNQVGSNLDSKLQNNTWNQYSQSLELTQNMIDSHLLYLENSLDE